MNERNCKPRRDPTSQRQRPIPQPAWPGATGPPRSHAAVTGEPRSPAQHSHPRWGPHWHPQQKGPGRPRNRACWAPPIHLHVARVHYWPGQPFSFPTPHTSQSRGPAGDRPRRGLPPGTCHSASHNSTHLTPLRALVQVSALMPSSSCRAGAHCPCAALPPVGRSTHGSPGRAPRRPLACSGAGHRRRAPRRLRPRWARWHGRR